MTMSIVFTHRIATDTALLLPTNLCRFQPKVATLCLQCDHKNLLMTIVTSYQLSGRKFDFEGVTETMEWG